jgi:trafficking protein particle complex subunit 6
VCDDVSNTAPEMSLAPSQPGYRTSLSTSSLVSPSLLTLTDAPLSQNQIDASVQDYFLIELMNTLRRSSQVAQERLKKQEQEMLANGLLPLTLSSAGSGSASALASTSRTSFGSAGAAGVATAKAPVNDEEEAVRVRLETLGAHVGADLAERCVPHTPLLAGLTNRTPKSDS